MAMTPEEMEAAINSLQARVTTLESQMASVASYPFMAYTQGESIGGQGPFTEAQGSTTQLWKNLDAIKKQSNA